MPIQLIGETLGSTYPIVSRNARSMLNAHLQRRLGTALVVVAAVAWSTAAVFTRLLHLDSWTILFWRGLFGGGFIAAFLIATQGRAGLRELAATGRSSWLVASLSTLGMVTFIPALQLTNVSNVAIIIATGPFVAAGIAWIWLREATRHSTLIAGFVALCGIAVIVGSPGGAADFRGIGLACIMTAAIAGMTVAVRRHKQISMVAAAALSNFLGSLVSIPFAQNLAGVTHRDLAVLALFGFFQVGTGLTLFVLGSRLLPSGQASLIATLETPLMPFWVWLAFGEFPTPRALIGGSLV
ncbi:MAG: EamA/RhaT family transporter, partial [Bradyrhizobium sp.]|nr:EamA/RhaT family transporter [Bradyrhizobium sp.]